MSKDKKRKFQAIINQNQFVNLQNSKNTESSKIKETTDRFLRSDLLKVFGLAISIIAIYIVLFFYDSNTGKITVFAEKISNVLIK
ncbi:MAG: hypothetical protein ABIH38_03600 [Patescibacteria group bacterium]